MANQLDQPQFHPAYRICHYPKPGNTTRHSATCAIASPSAHLHTFTAAVTHALLPPGASPAAAATPAMALEPNARGLSSTRHPCSNGRSCAFNAPGRLPHAHYLPPLPYPLLAPPHTCTTVHSWRTQAKLEPRAAGRAYHPPHFCASPCLPERRPPLRRFLASLLPPSTSLATVPAPRPHLVNTFLPQLPLCGYPPHADTSMSSPSASARSRCTAA